MQERDRPQDVSQVYRAFPSDLQGSLGALLVGFTRGAQLVSQNLPCLLDQKYLVDNSAVVTLDDILEDERLNYVERPIAIVDRKTKTLCNKVMILVKVQWQHWKGSQQTWEPEEDIHTQYSYLFATMDFEDEI